MTCLVNAPFGDPAAIAALEPVTAMRRSWPGLERQRYCFAQLPAHPSPGQHDVVQGVSATLMSPADIVSPVMADQQPPPDPHENDAPPPPDSGGGYVAISYLIGGMVVWGGIGWLVDHWLGTKGIAMGIGAVVGGAAGVYLIARRLGA
jgi:ATP synthase protein I